jgi:hypothetical protein
MGAPRLHIPRYHRANLAGDGSALVAVMESVIAFKSLIVNTYTHFGLPWRAACIHSGRRGPVCADWQFFGKVDQNQDFVLQSSSAIRRGVSFDNINPLVVLRWLINRRLGNTDLKVLEKVPA